MTRCSRIGVEKRTGGWLSFYVATDFVGPLFLSVHPVRPRVGLGAQNIAATIATDLNLYVATAVFANISTTRFIELRYVSNLISFPVVDTFL